MDVGFGELPFNLYLAFKKSWDFSGFLLPLNYILQCSTQHQVTCVPRLSSGGLPHIEIYFPCCFMTSGLQELKTNYDLIDYLASSRGESRGHVFVQLSTAYAETGLPALSLEVFPTNASLQLPSCWRWLRHVGIRGMATSPEHDCLWPAEAFRSFHSLITRGYLHLMSLFVGLMSLALGGVNL